MLSFVHFLPFAGIVSMLISWSECVYFLYAVEYIFFQLIKVYCNKMICKSSWHGDLIWFKALLRSTHAGSVSLCISYFISRFCLILFGCLHSIWPCGCHRAKYQKNVEAYHNRSGGMKPNIVPSCIRSENYMITFEVEEEKYGIHLAPACVWS